MKASSSFLISLISACILSFLVHPPSICYAWSLTSSILMTHHHHRRLYNSKMTLFSSLTKNFIEFSKYEGLGNDFILIDNRSSTEPSLTPQQAVQLCNRNFGIGADGVIFALAPPPPTSSSSSNTDVQYDFTMRIYNSDGSEPEMCGNGIRCFAAFLRDIGEEDKASLSVYTKAGKIIPIYNTDGTITVDMGTPIVDGPSIPTTLTPNADMNSIVEQTLQCNGKTFHVTCVSMGNPHCVIFVSNVDTDLKDFDTDGPALETHVVFPKKTNVEFVQVLSDQHLKMKVWERGAGPTLACGTGACALTVAAIRAGKIPRPNHIEGTVDNSIRVSLPGGDLFIEWRRSNNKIYMSGPANMSFMGKAALK